MSDTQPNKIQPLNQTQQFSVDVFFQQALDAHKSGALNDAKDAYHYILSLQPEHVGTLHALGMLASELQQWESAIAWLQRALTIQPDSAPCHFHLANSFKQTKQIEQALTHYQNALRLHPDYAEAYNNLAGLFYQQKQFNAARQHYRHAINLKPDYLEAHFNLGLVFLAQHKKMAAVTQFQNVIRLHPEHSQAHWQLATLYWQDQDLEKVEYHYQKIADLEPNSVELFNNFAALMLKKEQHNAAIDYLKRALTLDPKHKIARNNLANVLLQTHQFQEAIWHYSLYLNLEPLDTEALFHRAHGLMLTGQLHDALHDLKKILSIDDTQIEAHCNLAAIYLKLKDHASALTHYQTILALQTNHSIANYMVCALTQQSIPETAPLDYIKNLFDNYAFQFDAHLQNNLHYKIPQLLREQFQPFLQKKNYYLLDLGCGTGLSGACFTDISKKITGIDISQNMLAKAKEKNCYAVLIKKDILQGMTELTESFDLILCVDTLVYFGNLHQFFSHVLPCLSNKGLLGLSIELSQQNVLLYTLQTNGRYQHTQSYLIDLAKKNQLTLLSYKTVVGRHQEHQPISTGLFIFQKK